MLVIGYFQKNTTRHTEPEPQISILWGFPGSGMEMAYETNSVHKYFAILSLKLVEGHLKGNTEVASRLHIFSYKNIK